MGKDNKVILNNQSEEQRFNAGVASAAYNDLLTLATREILELIRTEYCKPLKLIVETSKDGKTRTVLGDKVGVLATFQLKNKKWVISEDSKMTSEEFETYTDQLLVRELLVEPAAESAYGEDALPPDGLIPIVEAVEIYSRGTEVHDLIMQFLEGKLPKITTNVREIAQVISIVNVPDQVRMLTALVDALDNLQNEPNVYVEPTYKDLLIRNPFGADKIVHALRLCYWTITDERHRLLGTPKTKSKTTLRDLILEKGSRYTEAVRKIAGKAVITGTRYPVITLKAAKIRLDLVSRPMFYTD